jgi:hypothetical protein
MVNLDRFNNYYIVKNHINGFNKNTIVKLITLYDDNYLIENYYGSDKTREWVYYGNLYPINKHNIGTIRYPYFNQEFDKIAEKFINNYE